MVLVTVSVLALLLGILAVAALRPNDFAIVRHVVVEKAASDVYPLVVNLESWRAWSPWEGLDPNLKRTYSGPERGVDARYEWSGNDAVGAGHMIIERADEDRLVILRLEFERPWKAKNQVEILLEELSGGTKVSWTMLGTSPFPMKVVGLFLNLDARIGKDFERGLANLKRVVETTGTRQLPGSVAR